ncbi:TetR/AcrR family transcriptional regulator [Yinghuangia seranimata]|uniref:TetR/AcrR family transcriptional regulator n=1 Tax=Yinghuangia seranimata TaxID=408067 RepID=UPI00248BD98D|nr:TetR/AcrR family transcriptional regulator [Yinghuangia seranimata]MDI2126069.1 TetR/AcrR family transcriptional regulator [Yinghuangia seranimata]
MTEVQADAPARQAGSADVRTDIPDVVASCGDLAVEIGYDHRRFPRRRGKVLQQAIAQAVVEELAERGYNGFTFEGVAARAGTGKSTLYRRWADKPSIVISGLAEAMPDLSDYESTGSLREDLLNVLHAYATSCDGTLGVALRVVCGEASASDDLREMWIERTVEPRMAQIAALIQAAVDRGEARPGATEYECVLTGPAMVGQLYMMERTAPSRDEVARLVDNVLMPMLESR